MQLRVGAAKPDANIKCRAAIKCRHQITKKQCSKHGMFGNGFVHCLEYILPRNDDHPDHDQRGFGEGDGLFFIQHFVVQHDDTIYSTA